MSALFKTCIFLPVAIISSLERPYKTIYEIPFGSLTSSCQFRVTSFLLRVKRLFRLQVQLHTNQTKFEWRLVLKQRHMVTITITCIPPPSKRHIICSQLRTGATISWRAQIETKCVFLLRCLLPVTQTLMRRELVLNWAAIVHRYVLFWAWLQSLYDMIGEGRVIVIFQLRTTGEGIGLKVKNDHRS